MRRQCRFGKTFCQECKMAMQRWSRDAVAKEIRRLSEQGCDLRHSQVAATYQRLVSAAVRYFGSWGTAVSAAGIDYGTIRRESQVARSAKVTRWSLERIDEEVRKLVDSGECLAAATARANHPALFSAAVSSRYYGSWRIALTSLGVDYDSLLDQNRGSTPAASDARGIRTIIKRLKVMARGPRTLSAAEASARYPRFYEQVIDRFGTWEAATEVAFDSNPT
jgi:hypothetical protein